MEKLKISLLEISKQANEIKDQLESLDFDSDLKDLLKIAQDDVVEDFTEKASVVAFAAQQYISEIDFLKEREKELKQRIKSHQSNVERIKQYLKYCFINAGIKSVKNDLLQIRVQNTASWPEIVDADAIPPEFCNFKIEVSGAGADMVKLFNIIEKSAEIHGMVVSANLTSTPDKREIKANLEEGFEVPGAKMPDFQPTTLIIK